MKRHGRPRRAAAATASTSCAAAAVTSSGDMSTYDTPRPLDDDNSYAAVVTGANGR